MRIIKPGTIKEVWCVRHGQSVENVDGYRRGEAGELTELGKLQAEAAAKRMEQLGIQALISSPSERALGTARAIADATGLDIVENELFNERRRPAATLGRHTDDPVVRKIHRHADVVGALTGHRQFADEDTFKDMLSSVREGFSVLLGHPAERICVVTHNMKLRVMYGYVHLRTAMTGMDFEDSYFTLDFDNGGITRFRYGAAWKEKIRPLWQIGGTNETAHLEGIEP